MGRSPCSRSDLHDLVAGLVQVDVDRHVQLVGQGAHALSGSSETA
jgi:hypothetical protein